MPRLLVDITAHGYGHLAQAAPVLNALCEILPGLELTVRSGLPADRLAKRIEANFRHIHAASDFGYVMRNAIDLDLESTARRYRELHADWDDAVAAEAAWLRAHGFDAVLTNVSYLPLAGAAHAGIPAAAMSSLNWLDLFAHSFAGQDWATPIAAQMADAYRSAAAFLRISPGLPMAAFDRRRVVGPVCRIAQGDRAAVANQLGVDAGETWLLVAMGGMEFPIDIARWPSVDGVRYFVAPALHVDRPDVTTYDTVPLDFTELLAACDAVITKPGYGTFVEAACHGLPVLYLDREGWLEAPFLVAWLHTHARAAPIARAELAAGRLMAPLAALRARPAPAKPRPTGIAEAADILKTLFWPPART